MYKKFSKDINNQLKWASLNENFIHINIDNEIKEYIWKYNVRERALILFLSYYFLKTWYHIAIKIHDAITIRVDLFLNHLYCDIVA